MNAFNGILPLSSAYRSILPPLVIPHSPRHLAFSTQSISFVGKVNVIILKYVKSIGFVVDRPEEYFKNTLSTLTRFINELAVKLTLSNLTLERISLWKDQSWVGWTTWIVTLILDSTERKMVADRRKVTG